MALKIGLIGLDTSHVEIFTKLLYEKNDYQFNNAKVVIGYPFPSLDIALSKNRVVNYTAILQKKYHVEIVNSINEMAEKADAYFITSLDGRKHLNIFKQLVHLKKPIFIDKPLAISSKDAKEIFQLSKSYHTPIMSSSALRYAHSLTTHLANEKNKPTGVYLNGPIPFIDHIPYYSWYGIHMIEMMFTILGTNYSNFSIHSNKNYEVISTEWNDGRFGIIRGSRVWHSKFEAIIHYENKTVHLPIYKDKKSYYASLLEEIISFCETSNSPIPERDTLTIIKFIEEANKIRSTKVKDSFA